MRYFVKMHGADTLPIECTYDYARAAYANAIDRDRADAMLYGGYTVCDINYAIWGTKISDREVFKQILDGDLQPGLLDL